MRRVLAVTLVVTACAGSTRTLAGVLEEIPAEVGAAVSALDAALTGPIDVPSRMLQHVADQGTSAEAGRLYDQVRRLDGTGVEVALARYTAFVGDLLLASGDLDAAIAAGDFEALAIAWLRIEATAGAMAVGLEPVDCAAVAPALVADLCRPDDLEGYDADLQRIVRRFLARYRPVMRLPAAFDDTVQGAIAGVLAPEVVASIDDALADLTVLTPPEHHAGVYAAFTGHLTRLRQLWSAPRPWGEFVDDLEAEACDAAIDFVAGRVTLRFVDPGSTISDLGALWLYGEGTGCP